MRILVTNDDGIDAPGLSILIDAARAVSEDVWVVAPATEQSGQSHAVTLVNPLRISRIAEKHYAVSGTPADCVAMAFEVALDRPPDLVLSGVNQGFNIADDMLYSGTVGAAMQASSAGARAIAFSQAYRRIGQEKEADIWDAARTHCQDTLKTLLSVEVEPGTVLNVNFPACAAAEVSGLAVTRQGKRDRNEVYTDSRIDGRGHAYHWLRFRREVSDPAPGTDLAALADRRISVTPLSADLTRHAAVGALAGALGMEDADGG